MSSSAGTTQTKRTPLYERHVALNARMVPFAGWEMPLSYSGQLAEHRAVREGTGIFDVSHMGQIRFRGAGAEDFLQWLLPADIRPLAPGHSKYTQLCREDGGILDDLIVSRLDAADFFAVVNAATKEKDLSWIRQKAKESGFEVTIADESEHWAMIAVQGPKALELLNPMIPIVPLATLPAFSITGFGLGAAHHFLSRTGYTGELGAEILCPANLAVNWWDRLLAAGAQPCGLAARDSLRLEAGYCLYGQDLDETTTPIEAGLGWSVSFRKQENFIGREVLERQKAEGTSRRLVGLLSEGRRPLRHGDEVVSGGEVAGQIASGGFSPQLNRGIGLGYVRTEFAKSGNLAVRSRGNDTPVQVVRPPFVKTSLSK